MLITRGFIELLKNDCGECDRNLDNKNRDKAALECNHESEQECFNRIHELLEKIKELKK
jgi:hypothetical protein